MRKLPMDAMHHVFKTPTHGLDNQISLDHIGSHDGTNIQTGLEPNSMSAILRPAALPDFVLRQFERDSTEPDHRQLYLILQRGIRQSVLMPGTKLPPTRSLAESLDIARNTVVHVYEQLAL